MATYDQNPAYNTYQFRGYDLPVEGIARAISQRSEYWKVSAEQLKSSYEQAAGLSLSRADNKAILQDFMIKADDLVKKASRTDLSVAENRNAANKIFKPLYQDQSIMGDHALTEFYNQQQQLSDSYKTKDGGKQYSNMNVDYMNEKYSDFIADPNRENWQKHYNTRRGYTPYYDYSKEFEDITKNCKPNNFSSQDLTRDVSGNVTDTLYFNVSQNKGVSQSKLNGCLQAGMSQQAKQQLGIEGYMRYGKNYEGLSRDYLAYSDSELNPMIEQKKAMDGAIQGLIDKQKSTGITEAESAKLQQLQQTSTGLNTYIGDQLKTRDKVAGGDMNYIRDNYETLSGSLYVGQKINQYSQYYQYQDVTQKLEENNAAMLVYKVQNEASQMAARFEQQKQIEQLRLSNDIILEQIKQAGKDSGSNALGVSTRTRMVNGRLITEPDYPNLNPAATDQNLVTSSEAIINDTYTQATQNKSNADNWLFTRFKDKFPQYTNPQALIQSPEFANYSKQHPDDSTLSKWRIEANAASNDIIRMEGIKSSVEETLRTNNPEFFDNSRLAGLNAIRVGTTAYVTPVQLRDALNGVDRNVKVEYSPTQTFVAGSNLGVPSGAQVFQPKITYNGVDISNVPGMKNLLSGVDRANKQITGDINAKRQELYATKRLELEGYKDISQDNANKNNRLKLRVASSLGVDPDQVNLRYSNMTGDVFLGLTSTDKKPAPNTEDALVKLRGAFKADQEGELLKLSQVPEYAFFSGTSVYKDQLSFVDSMLQINKDKLAQGTPIDIPVQSESDLLSGSSVPSYKIILEKGIRAGEYIYTIGKKQPDGTFQKANQLLSSPVEAMKYIETLDKANGR